MKVLSVSSAKGGVSKTTVAVNLSQAYAQLGKKVLVIDFDHNNNCTDYFLRNTDVEEIENRNLYHVLTGKKNIQECIFSISPYIDILPATPMLSRIEIELARDPGVFLRFPAMLQRMEYDYIVNDTPPSISYALTVALYASELVICPVSWSRWTIQGYSLLEEECLRASQGSGSEIQLFALPSMVTDIERDKLRAIEIWTASKSFINKNLAIKNAGSSGAILRPDSVSWQQFEALAEEFK